MTSLTLPNTLTGADWDNIVYAIEKNQCVIVLGPGVAIDSHKERLHDKICKQIADNLGTPNIDSPENFLNLTEKLLKEKAGVRYLSGFIKDTFCFTSPSEIHDTLAKLPFLLYLSFSPDILLKSALEGMRFNPQFHYFHFKTTENLGDKKVLEKPTLNTPIIYNLFGSVEEEDSLILTHDHLFDFLFALMGSFPLPEVVLETIKTAKNFIFLGFDIESWYLKLILRKFGLHEKRELPSYALYWQSLSNQGAVQFYSEKFNLTFVNNTVSDIEVFLKELFNNCEEKQVHTRKIMSSFPNSINYIDEVLDLIGKAETELAIQKLEDKFKATSQYVSLIRIKAVFSSHKANVAKGIMKVEDINISINQIHDQLIQFVTSN